MAQKYDDYARAWATVDSLLNLQQTRGALEKAEAIYRRAQAEGNAPQIYKALCVTAKARYELNDTTAVKEIFARFHEEIARLPPPVKNMAQSTLASLYWAYYEQNRYKFLDRTATEGFDPDDIETWDLRRLAETVAGLYDASLQNSDLLRQIPLADYHDHVITRVPDPEISRQVQKSVFDLLAKRAFDFFSGAESGLNQPVYVFELTDDVGGRSLFAPAAAFVTRTFSTRDSASFLWRAANIVQSLLAAHLSDPDPVALVHYELIRLKFVYDRAVRVENKDVQYLSALEDLRQKYSSHAVFAEIAYVEAAFRDQLARQFSPHDPRTEKYRWERKKALDLCRAAAEQYPQTHGGKNCLALKADILRPSAALETEKVLLPGEEFPVSLVVRNLDRFYLRVAKQKDPANAPLHLRDDAERLAHYRSLPPAVPDFSVSIPLPDDYQTHRIEVPVPALEKGAYVLLASTSPDFDDEGRLVLTAPLWVSELGWHTDAEYLYGRLRIAHRKTGAPLAGVKVDRFLDVYDSNTGQYRLKEIDTQLSGADGLVVFKPAPSRERYYYDSFYFRLQTQDDLLFLTDEGMSGYNYYDVPEPVSATRVFFFTDRSIYRPGQTIYFKALAVEEKGGKYAPAADRNFDVEFRDPNGKTAGKLHLRTNEYGSMEGTFVAPPGGVITGRFVLDCRWGQGYVSVEEYKRPKFEVRFEATTESYALGGEVKLTGLATAYAGAGVAGAKVTYRVVRKARFPYWRRWWMPPPAAEAMEILHGQTVADADGRFSIAFIAVPDPSIEAETEPEFTYEITADVTDAAGETRTGRTSVSVGYVALRVLLNLPERIETSKIPALKAVFTNLAGQKATAAGALHVRRVQDPERTVRHRYFAAPDLFLTSKEEFARRCPRFPYAEEHLPPHRPPEAILHTQKFSGSECQFDFLEKMKTWKPGDYVLTLETTDAFGKPVRVERRFALRAPDSPAPPTETFRIEWFRTRGEPGENVVFTVGAAYAAHFYYVVEHDGKTVEKHVVALNGQTRKIEIPIREPWRGGFVVRYSAVGENRFHAGMQTVEVPWTNRELKLSFSTFRDKLSPGSQETWTMTVKGPKGEAAAAEALAAMYDASLDAFLPHAWPSLPLKSAFVPYMNRSSAGYGYRVAESYARKWADEYPGFLEWEWEKLMDFGVTEVFENYRRYYKRSLRVRMAQAPGGADDEDAMADGDAAGDAEAYEEVRPQARAAPAFVGAPPPQSVSTKKRNGSFAPDDSPEHDAPNAVGPVKVRTDLRETAFFYPLLRTDENGAISFSFTAPEALTRWKVMAFAHDKNMRFGTLTDTVVTQKTLMVMPNAPRFFREGDKIAFPVKVVNLHEKALEATVELRLFDARTMKPVDAEFQNTVPVQTVRAPAGQSAAAFWQLEIPVGRQAVVWRVVARAGEFSDGEESALPVLTHRTLVTESLPLCVRGKQTKHFTFQKLLQNASSTLRHHSLTLEYASNPAWYAVQALPYLMEFPHECSEQTFSRYYANALAEHVVQSDPKIRQVFESWKNFQPDALLSNLESNQELKALLLEETPWVREAMDETEQKRRIALLFDLNRMAAEKQRALKKLREMQTSSGGFVWFPGFREDAFITRHIACGLMKLRALGVRTDVSDVQTMVEHAVVFSDRAMSREYRELEREYENRLPDRSFLHHDAIHYLYMRSFAGIFGMAIEPEDKEMYDFWLNQCRKYWTTQNKYGQAMIALVLHRRAATTKKSETVPGLILKALKENAIYSEEQGTYWKDLTGGFYWHQAPIETMALLIEAFDEAGQDPSMTDGMKVWLLKNKHTNRWETTKATVEACYALLMRGSSLLADVEPAQITLGGKAVEFRTARAGTGYVKTRYDGPEIENDMGRIVVQSAHELVSWGAVYWQYFEDMDKISSHTETGLKIVKQIFRQKNTDRGPVVEPVGDNAGLSPGDLVKVRIEIRSDRDLEYVHLKDMRAAGLEPVDVLSQSRFQDGLYYYQSTRDAATHFFFDRLPKGTYVFEYDLRVFHQGDFSAGIATAQCMYAPEFASHSQGMRVRVR